MGENDTPPPNLLPTPVGPFELGTLTQTRNEALSGPLDTLATVVRAVRAVADLQNGLITEMDKTRVAVDAVIRYLQDLGVLEQFFTELEGITPAQVNAWSDVAFVAASSLFWQHVTKPE